MDIFEGYVGIRLWDGQLVDDVIFSLLLLLFVSFALVFHSNFRLFVKMMRDVVFIKERQSLFEKVSGSEAFFRNFMIFQTLFLCSIIFFADMRIKGHLHQMDNNEAFAIISIFFIVLFLFFEFKQCLYCLFGIVFADPSKYKFWKTNYNAIIGAWGVLLYIPAIWLVFVGVHLSVSTVLFVIFYILCRIAIIYKTIRIFHKKNTGILYISLYLCGQEILPLVFLYEGMVYLYNFIETSAIWH